MLHKKLSLFVWITLLSGSMLLAQEEIHPRLFLTQERLLQIKNAVLVSGSHHYLAFQALKSRVDTRDPDTYSLGTPTPGYDHMALAKEAAFAYQITQDTSYASLAFEMLREVAGLPEVSATDSRRGLTRAMAGVGFALAYDWCYNAWSQPRRTWARDIIRKALNEWTEFEYPVAGWGEGTNHIWAPYRSNWVAVCQGSQILMTLAAYEENSTATNLYINSDGDMIPGISRPKRLELLKNQLLQHVQGAYGSLGVTGEGLGYLGFGSSFLQPTLQAMRQLGDRYIDTVAVRKEWWRWVMYASSFTPDRFSLQNGCSGSGGIDGLGCASLLLGTVPAEQLPYYLHFYDRFMGVAAPRKPDKKFDESRAGTIWALILYPESVSAQSPDNVLKPMAADMVKGAFFFRNRWQDENDILVSFMADTDWEKGVHNVAEAFQINLVAHGTKYVGSVGRGYLQELQSSLFVDGKPFDSQHDRAASDTGTIEMVRETKYGGYVIAGGGQKYSFLGLTSARRHCKVDFFPARNKALISVLDEIRASSNHQYSWQLNIGDETGNRGIKVDTATEDGRPVFVLRGNNGSFVKGWIVHPAAARIVPADPLRITTTGSSTEILVVMLVDSGLPPVATISGSGLGSQLTIEDAMVTFDNAGKLITVTSDQLAVKPEHGRFAGRSQAFSIAQAHGPNGYMLQYVSDGDAGLLLTAYSLAGRTLQRIKLSSQPGVHTVAWRRSSPDGSSHGWGGGPVLFRLTDSSRKVRGQVLVH